MPGVPFVIIGHNDHIAWGLTATQGDLQDLFIERFDPTDPDNYLTPEGSREFVVREEIIKVRDAEDIRLRVRESRHGPVISDLFGMPPSIGGPPVRGNVLALATTYLGSDDLTPQAMFRLNRAHDMASFRRAAAIEVIHGDNVGAAVQQFQHRRTGGHAGREGKSVTAGFEIGDVLFDQVRRRSSNLDFSYIDLSDGDALAAALRPETKMIWIETPTNPMLKLVDLAAAAEFAKTHNLISVVDNTFATPWLQRPLEHGIDIVVHSATKYLNGHSNMVGGVAVVGDNDDLAERLGFLQNAVGGIAGPFDAYLALRGLKTLEVRMERHCASAE